jgi:hypothetical protein
MLTSARQTGKTYTFLRLFPEHEFVSLDLPTEAEQAEKRPSKPRSTPPQSMSSCAPGKTRI